MTGASEQGSVSVVLVAAMGVALVCTMGVADVGRVLVERSHAEAAADAAALAAAQDLAVGAGDPAADATRFADDNGTVLVACSCATGSGEAVVTVRRSFTGLLLVPGSLTVEAQARAVVDLP
jgi:secretion/DNA translocation related TadE-like protein